MLPIKVFCPHCSLDKPHVEALARRLPEAGIDAWLDIWEIDGGDDIVARIEQGLCERDWALLFCSTQSSRGPWFKAEQSALIAGLIGQGRPLIPIPLEAEPPSRSC